MKKKPVVKKRVTHKAATPPKHSTTHHDEPRTQPRPLNRVERKDDFPEETKQAERLDQLVKDVKMAFESNGFAVPGDIALQVRSMANTLPHHAPRPETQPGPGVAAAVG